MAVTGAPELLIVMGASATQEQVDEVVARLDEAGCSALVTPGREATVIGAIGERELLATLPLEGFAGVEQVLPILKPYKLASRELSPDPTVIEVRGRRIGDGYFGFIAGPRTVETREQTLEPARPVAAERVTMLRGGAFKPPTSPSAFRGLAGGRGIEAAEAATRVALDIGANPVLKQETHLPLIVVPPHPAGRRDLVLPLARAAVAAGADGVIVEVHPRPGEALCDAVQQIPAAEFEDFASEIRALCSLMGRVIG